MSMNEAASKLFKISFGTFLKILIRKSLLASGASIYLIDDVKLAIAARRRKERVSQE
jgi:hypothetical protein